MQSEPHREYLLISSELGNQFVNDRKQVEVITRPGKTRVLIAALCVSVVCNVFVVVFFFVHKEILLQSEAGAQRGHCARLEKNNVCLPCSSKEQFILASGETRDIKWVTLCSYDNLCCLESYEPLSRLTQIVLIHTVYGTQIRFFSSSLIYLRHKNCYNIVFYKSKVNLFRRSFNIGETLYIEVELEVRVCQSVFFIVLFSFLIKALSDVLSIKYGETTDKIKTLINSIYINTRNASVTSIKRSIRFFLTCILWLQNRKKT
ncbi:hypothetical protein ACJMK2_044040 [Sinanodonta woodiana]|uniref:Uncharacterized protein n=1 Tax=Sinanodonta woodiana TaxID=1069815 RepID=A0ABD3VYQ8_SINWO